MSTIFYRCENCGKDLGNGNWTRRHLTEHYDHICTETHYLTGREPQVRVGITAQTLGVVQPAETNNEEEREEVIRARVQQVTQLLQRKIVELTRESETWKNVAEDFGQHCEKLQRLLERLFYGYEDGMRGNVE